MKDILTDAFIGLFLEHPETKDKFFEFRDITIEDLKRSSDTQTSEFSDAKSQKLSVDLRIPYFESSY